MNIFHFAAGVSPEVIALCSPAEKNKYAQLGSLVYIPLVTGMLAVLFASLYHTHNAFAIALVCLVWGGVVFVIERTLIASLRPGNFSAAVLFRVVLAFAMSMVISELLILFVFNKDVEAVIVQQHTAQLEQIRAQGDESIRQLNEQLSQAQARVQEAYDGLYNETAGISGSGHYGYGPAQRAAQNRMEWAQAQLDAANAEIPARIREAQDETERALGEARRYQILGLLDALATLHEMAHERRIVMIILLVAHILFLTIELMPLVIKLNYKGSQYYTILDAKDRIHTEYEVKVQEMAAANQMLKMKLQATAEQAGFSADILLNTLLELDQAELKGLHDLSEDSASSYKQQLEAIVTSYLGHTRNILTA